jgi:hypothetical protein
MLPKLHLTRMAPSFFPSRQRFASPTEAETTKNGDGQTLS